MPALPAPTKDLHRALADLALHGMCIMPRVLSCAELNKLREALQAAVDEDTRLQRAQTGLALDNNDHNLRVWNLLSRGPAFCDLAQHPIALELIRSTVGWPALLSNISANITLPGACRGVIHADQVFVPEPWPSAPQGLNVAWCLDDFTTENGATEVVPGSHRLNRNPRQNDSPHFVPVVAPAGSLFAFNSRIWHRSGANTSVRAKRAEIFPFYTRTTYRTQENWFLSLSPEIIESASDTLLTLLAYRTELFGLVFGRSPR